MFNFGKNSSIKLIEVEYPKKCLCNDYYSPSLERGKGIIINIELHDHLEMRGSNPHNGSSFLIALSEFLRDEAEKIKKEGL